MEEYRLSVLSCSFLSAITCLFLSDYNALSAGEGLVFSVAAMFSVGWGVLMTIVCGVKLLWSKVL